MILRILFLLLISFSVEATTTYYADPNGSGAACTSGTPCTITQSITTAATGDTIVANCGTYDLVAATLTVNKNVTIEPVTSRCATITSTNATAVVTLTASNDANTLTFGSFVVQNTGGGTSSTILISNVAYDAIVELSETSVTVGGTNRHINDAWTRGTVKLTNVSLSGTIGAQAGFYSSTTPSSAKKVKVYGLNATLTASAGNTPGVMIQRAAANSTSEWVYVGYSSVNITVPPALGTGAQAMGIRFDRITSGTDLDGVTTPAIMEYNTVTVTATAGTSADTEALTISSTDATARGDYGIIRYNTATCNAPAARCVTLGIDGSTASTVDYGQIYGNSVYGTFYDGSATPHGINLGRVAGGRVFGNYVQGFAVGILAGINNGGVITGNIVRGAGYAPLYAKGNTSVTIANNTVVQDSSVLGDNFGSYGALAVAVQGATNNAATLFANNNIYCLTACRTYVTVDASQAATFQKNNYFSIVAPSQSNAWSYQGSGQTSLSGWQGAQEATATATNPLMRSNSPRSAVDVALLPSSTLRRTGQELNIGNYQDYGNRAFLHPPSVGAREVASGDEASNRATR